jgi:putative Mn2+ efflux pump MntP
LEPEVSIVIVSAIYLSVTIFGMVVMVNLALKGIKKIERHFLERHEKLITGVVLIIIGALIYFVEI